MNPGNLQDQLNPNDEQLMPQTCIPASKVNNDLVTRALNYHGQQLTSFFKETPVFHDLDLKNVDYHLYHQRSKELRMEDRGKRLLLHRFISQNAQKLFKEDPCAEAVFTSDTVRLDNDQTEELAALLPPYEVFTNVNEDDRCRHFFDSIVAGDVMLCRVVQKSMSGLMLSVLCLDPITNKSRYIEDLRIRCFCPSGEMIPASDPKDPVRSYEPGDVVRVVCLEVKLESQRLLAGMKASGLRPELAATGLVKLGLCPPTKLPAAFSYTSQAREKSIPYSIFLEKSVGFINPTNVNHLASELGLDVKGDSLMTSLSGKFKPQTYASSLRKDQASKWAYKHVAQGIKFFKAGNNVEAFQCLNQALNIDADNVEGLVARGALYANNGGLDKAVEDFEKALLINRSHKNARKYLCETLIAVARNHEDENKVELAIETYQRILTIVPDHKEALDSIYFLRGKPKDAPLRDDPKQGEKRNKPKLSLDGDKDKSEKKKKKKRRRHSSGTSSGSDSDSGDSSRKHKKKKDRKSRSDSQSPSPLSKRPVSPFSAKMAPGDSGVPAGGVMNMPEEFQKSAPSQLAMNLPLPDLRHDIERLKSQKSEDGEEAQTPGLKPVPPGFPMIDLTKPPPGYLPPAPSHEQEYDEKVRRFLEETAQGGARSSSSQKRRSGQSSRREHRTSRSRRRSSRRSRSSSRHRKGSRRRRSREIRKSRGSKSRSKSRDKEKKQLKEQNENNESSEKILIEDDDFTKKLNDHLSSSKKHRSKSRSKEKKSRNRSKDRKYKRNSRSRSKEKKNKSRSTSKERKRSESKENFQTLIQSPIKDTQAKKSVFDRLDCVPTPNKDVKNTHQGKLLPASGMWIPTGEDSIIEGVKEAIHKVEKKERRRSGEDNIKTNRHSGESSINVEFEIKYDGRTGMYTRVPKKNSNSARDDIVELESRIIRKLPDSPAAKVLEKKSRRSKSRDRRRSGRSRSQRDKSGSRSRRKRSRSHHRQRSRSKSRRKSRKSRSREKKRSHSRSRRRRSMSRTKSPGWKDRSDYKETQAKLHQSDITDLREETRRLQTEREAVFREKERLLSGPASTGGPASKAKVDTQASGGGKVGDEFSGLDNVMNSVLEAVAPRPSNIIPGTQTFEDLEAFLKRKKSEKLEEMKKNL